MNERDKVKIKITALLSKTIDRGASEHEALSAAEKAAQLMAHYDIEATELDFKSRSCVEKITYKLKYGNKQLGSYISVQVAVLCDCKVWESGNDLIFFGFEQDAEIACYIFDTLSNAIVAELRTYQNSADHKHLCSQGYHGRSLAASFLFGIEDRLCERIKDMAVTKRNEVRASTGTDLVPVKGAQIQGEFEDLSLSLRKANRRITARCGSAIVAGHAAGARVNISEGITSQSARAIA